MKENTKFSIIILTLNEEASLARAIKSCSSLDHHVTIIDSHSTDRTVDIARELGATVFFREFDNFSNQWNFALSAPRLRSIFTIKLDADEEISEELAAELNALSELESINAYQVRRRLFFLGAKLSIFDTPVRIWKTGKVRFSENRVNEQPLFEGPSRMIRGDLLHHDSINIARWVEKQNLYTSLESQQSIKIFVRKTAARDVYIRSVLKKFFYYVPFRYNILFLYYFLFRGMFRDGPQGVKWIRSRIIVYTLFELKRAEHITLEHDRYL